MHQVIRDYGSPLCRSCLNKLWGTNLKRRNCYYAGYPGYCPCCHTDDKNLVIKLRPSGKLKVFLRK